MGTATAGRCSVPWCCCSSGGRREALLSADDRARIARVKRMDEELSGKLRGEEVREAAVAKQAAFRDAVRGMSVGAAAALLDGKSDARRP